jgi:hypothetical protein
MPQPCLKTEPKILIYQFGGKKIQRQADKRIPTGNSITSKKQRLG